MSLPEDTVITEIGKEKANQEMLEKLDPPRQGRVVQPFIVWLKTEIQNPLGNAKVVERAKITDLSKVGDKGMLQLNAEQKKWPILAYRLVETRINGRSHNQTADDIPAVEHLRSYIETVANAGAGTIQRLREERSALEERVKELEENERNAKKASASATAKKSTVSKEDGGEKGK